MCSTIWTLFVQEDHCWCPSILQFCCHSSIIVTVNAYLVLRLLWEFSFPSLEESYISHLWLFFPGRVLNHHCHHFLWCYLFLLQSLPFPPAVFLINFDCTINCTLQFGLASLINFDCTINCTLQFGLASFSFEISFKDVAIIFLHCLALKFLSRM